jgi:hypothetical protein
MKEGEVIPDLRSCVDYVGRGSIRSDGSRLIEDPDDLLGHAIYNYRYRERAAIVGKRDQRGTLVLAGHTLRDVRLRDAVVFTATSRGRERFVGWTWVWRDTKGRPFIPIFGWPEGENGFGWEPSAIRRFAKPVSYRDPQPYWPDTEWAPGDAEPGLIEIGQGRMRVLQGLYLADLPAMFRVAALSERCWR